MFKMINMFNCFAAEAGRVSQDVKIDITRLPDTLKHMGVGMLSIFIVIGVIILAVYLLNNNIFASLKNKKKK